MHTVHRVSPRHQENLRTQFGVRKLRPLTNDPSYDHVMHGSVNESRSVVIKSPRTPKDHTSTLTEMNAFLACKNIRGMVNLIGVSQSPREGSLLVIENYEGGDLVTYINELHKNNTEVPVTDIMRPLMYRAGRTLAHMHRRGWCHRDVKPENMFLDKTRRRVFIGDLQFACRMEKGKLLTTFPGTAAYAAPEVCCQLPYDGAKADAYAYGVTLFMCVFLRGLMDRNAQMHKLYFFLLRLHIGELPYPEGVYVDPHLRKLLRRLVALRPEKRWTVEQAVRKSAWFAPEREKARRRRGRKTRTKRGGGWVKGSFPVR